MQESFDQEQPPPDEMIDILAEAAHDIGLKARLPEKGTPVYDRLYSLCLNYSNARHKATRNISDDLAFAQYNGIERRQHHNELCKMIFGTSYDDTPWERRKALANFAHYVAGREQYIE